MKLHEGYSVLKRLRTETSGKVWKRVCAYGQSLLTPKEGVPIDKHVLKLLLKSASDSSNRKAALLSETVEYLKEVKFMQGIYVPDQIEEQLQRFEMDNHDVYAPRFESFKHVHEEMINEVRHLNLTPLQYESEQDLLDALPKEKSHPGWTGLIHGFRTKKEVIRKLGFKTWLKEIHSAVKEGSFNKFIVITSRNQASLPFKDGKRTNEWKTKTRFISIVDTWVILAERMFQKPFQEFMASQNWYAGGFDDEGIQKKMVKWSSEFAYSFTTDYSKYDQSISDYLIHAAFDYIEAAFKMNDFEARLFRVIRQDFIHKVFLDGNLNPRESHKGVPSGSMFTSLIDSIVNRLMIKTYLYEKSILDVQFMIMGDDNIIFTGYKIDKDDLAKFLTERYGIQVNADKIEFAHHWEGQSPRFLSREWRASGVYRDPKELIFKMLCPERYRNYKHNPDLKPEFIVKGYIDSFPLGMAEIIDTNAFVRDHSLVRLEKLKKNQLEAILPHLPGSIQVQMLA